MATKKKEGAVVRRVSRGKSQAEKTLAKITTFPEV